MSQAELGSIASAPSFFLDRLATLGLRVARVVERLGIV